VCNEVTLISYFYTTFLTLTLALSQIWEKEQVPLQFNMGLFDQCNSVITQANRDG